MGKGLYIMHLNIRSLLPKIDQLRAWLAYNNPNIITLSKTWLTSNISDADISIDNYKLFRSDRSTRGGGVATYVLSNLNSQLMVPNEIPVHFEGLFIKITLHENKQLIIGNIYRPPNSPKLDSIKHIISTASSLVSNKEMILMGDFNINWLHSSAFTERNMINSLNLTQLIT